MRYDLDYQIYQEGFDAFCDGLTLDDCPYKNQGFYRDRWLEGFLAAEEFEEECSE